MAKDNYIPCVLDDSEECANCGNDCYVPFFDEYQDDDINGDDYCNTFNDD